MAKFKLTRPDIKRALKLKNGGALDKDIAAAIGVQPQTFSTWINHPKTELQRELSEELKKTEADYKNRLTALILRDAEEKDWKAAAWLLERKYPAEYGRVDRLQAEVNQTTQAAVKVEHYFDYGEGNEE